MPDCHQLTAEDVRRAHQVFLQNEPRDLFYRAAVHLVQDAWNQQSPFTIAEAVSILLKTWNRPFYQYRRFTNEHIQQIEDLFTTHRNSLAQFRNRNISNLSDEDEQNITLLFQAFESVLGPVGTAKTFHLTSPCFFPIWDRTIAIAYNLPLSETGTNGNKYVAFMKCQRNQVALIVNSIPDGISAIKAIDEYNYCHFSKSWI